MKKALCRVKGVRQVAENTFVLRFIAPHISTTIRPGQFVSIRVEETTDPLLRRPFSIYRTNGEESEIIFNVIGRGSASLRRKREGDWIDVLGPLGVPFSSEGQYDTAILMGGGLGVAPLPLLTMSLRRSGKSLVTVIGARSAAQVVDAHLYNLHIATDDGSRGFHGTVVDLATQLLTADPPRKPMIFACGPTAMLRAVAALAVKEDIPCEVSLEGPMGCGFGVCQGCPVELVGSEKKYALMCKDGPTFDVRKVKF